MPIIVDRRLQDCSRSELDRMMRLLYDLWVIKGKTRFSHMGLRWNREVAELGEELRRRGVQLRLFEDDWTESELTRQLRGPAA